MVPQEMKHRIPYDSALLFLGTDPKRIESRFKQIFVHADYSSIISQ